MTGEPRLVRETLVSECQHLLTIEPLLVHPGDDLVAVAHRALTQPQTRVVGVVDPDGHLVGILPVRRLVEDIVARVAPEALMAGLTDVGGVAQFSHAVEARTVADTMLAPVSIRGEATVGEALRRIHGLNLSGLYVVDAGKRVTGYVDLLELALLYLDGLEPRPSDKPQQPRDNQA